MNVPSTPATLEDILAPGLRRRSGFSVPRRLWEAARSVVRASGELLYPSHCLACGSPLAVEGNGALCGPCAARIDWIGADRCRRCGGRVGQGRGVVERCPACSVQPPVFVSASCAVAAYDGPLRALILGLKFGGAFPAAFLLGRLLAFRIRATGLLGDGKSPVALVPVPLERKLFRSRGFNQSEELARAAGRELALPLERRLLQKIRATRPQAKLGREARRENVKDAFAADEKCAAAYREGCVVLMDDVMTTGATAGECAKTLCRAGVGEVRVAVAARA